VFRARRKNETARLGVRDIPQGKKGLGTEKNKREVLDQQKAAKKVIDHHVNGQTGMGF